MRSGAAARHLLTSSKGPDVTARMLGRSRISSIARRTSSSVRGARSGERHDFTRSAVNGSLGSRPGKTISWSLVHTAGGGVPYILSVCACRCMSIIGGGIVCACRGTETEIRTTPERFLIVCTPQRAIRRPNAPAKLLHANACRASLVPHYTTRRRRRRVRIGGDDNGGGGNAAAGGAGSPWSGVGLPRNVSFSRLSGSRSLCRPFGGPPIRRMVECLQMRTDLHRPCGQTVRGLGRIAWHILTIHQALSFERAQTHGEHTRRDPVHLASQHSEPRRAIADQDPQDMQRPPACNGREQPADGVARAWRRYATDKGLCDRPRSSRHGYSQVPTLQDRSDSSQYRRPDEG